MKPDPGPLTPAQSAYLLFGIFLTGGVILVLELVGSRLISPYYGSSIYCWASIITVTMVALAAGYHLGGRAADRATTPALFARIVAAAGLAVAVIPVFRIPMLRLTSPMGIRLGSLASAAFLLAPSLTILAALGPVVVKLTTRDVRTVGRSAGMAMAVSTLGSVVGAVAAGFWLIPSFPVSGVIYGTAALLLVLAAAGAALLGGGAPVKTVAAAVAAAACGAWARPAPAGELLFSKHSPYGEIKVLDSDDRRYLFVDGTSQSVAILRDAKAAGSGRAAGEPMDSESPYLHTMEFAAVLRPRARKALFIGCGAGLLPQAFADRYGIASDVVEIDPSMLEAASRFGFDRYGVGGDVFVEDGRAHIEKTRARYDIIVLDAFAGENPPYHLFTAESFATARRILSPDGVLTANLVSLVAGPRQPWVAAYKAMRSAFKDVRAFAVSEPYQGLTNVVFFCGESLGPPKSLAPPAGGPVAGGNIPFHQAAPRELIRKSLSFAMSHELVPSPAQLDEAPALTDDFAPVESLLAATSLRWRKLILQSVDESILHP
ncbi:MAG: fused MFS/spermidine synthase [Elusimicrobia bacterium]|nr:fused MFS/spermidine synthase [Elusimicrobiota bacterium]